MFYRKLPLFAAAALACLLPAQQPQQPAARGSDSAKSDSLKEADRKFLQRAAMDGMMEVEISQMAAQKATHPDVKSYAQRMVDDHTAANEQLKSLAQSKGLELGSHQGHSSKAGSRLHSLSGQEFDRAFMTQQVRHHQKDVAEFERQARSSGDADVRAFAEKTLPTLRQHLEQARSISASLSGAGGQQSSTTTNPDTEGRKK